MPLTVTIGDESHPIRPDAMGYNGDFINGGSWQDADLLQAFKSLDAGHLRYPAGTISNYWDWHTGWFRKDATNLPHGWGGARKNPYTLEDLKIAVDAAGVTPLFVVNMLTSTLDDQLAMLRAASKLGMPVERVELGNEYYLSSKDYIKKFPTATSYGEAANQWAAKIKAEFPGVKVAVAGAAVRSSDNARRKGWNDELYPVLKNIDAVSIHVYEGTGLGDPAKQLEETGLVEDTEAKTSKPKDGMWEADRVQEQQWKRFSTGAGLKRMMEGPAGRYNYLNEVKDLPAGLEAWLSEYNLFDRVGPVRGTWAHGLFAAQLPLNFLRSPRVQMMTYHDLYGGPVFSAIFRGNGGFSKLSTQISAKTLEVTPYSLTAMGQANQLIGIAMKGATQVRALEFARDQSDLIGDVFSRDGVKPRAAVLINATGQSFSWSQTPFAATAQVTQLSGDPRSYVTGPDSLTCVQRALGDKLDLPAYSVTLIEEATP